MLRRYTNANGLGGLNLLRTTHMTGPSAIYDSLRGFTHVNLSCAEVHSLVALIMLTYVYEIDAMKYICRNDRRAQSKNLLALGIECLLTGPAATRARQWLYRDKK